MADELAVWLYGERVAVIDRERGRPRLVYTDEALSGTPWARRCCLSRCPWAPPIHAGHRPPVPRRPAARGRVAQVDRPRRRRPPSRHVRLDPRARTGLRRRGCHPASRRSALLRDQPRHRRSRSVPEEIEALVRDLRSAPLGAGGRVRISLAGVQEKLVLTRMPDGSWGRPVDGTPSTHILKPEIAAYPQTVENEAFCMRVAKHLGLDVAAVETTEIGRTQADRRRALRPRRRRRRLGRAHPSRGLLPGDGRRARDEVRGGRRAVAAADRRHPAVCCRARLAGATSAGGHR